jgi:hypothetical protein
VGNEFGIASTTLRHAWVRFPICAEIRPFLERLSLASIPLLKARRSPSSNALKRGTKLLRHRPMKITLGGAGAKGHRFKIFLGARWPAKFDSARRG